MYVFHMVCLSFQDTYDSSGRLEGKPLRVMIEFSLEQPRGGVQFVIPPGSSPEAMVSEGVCEGEGRMV